LNAAFVIAILDLISPVYLPSFVNLLPKYLKQVDSTIDLKNVTFAYDITGTLSVKT